MNTHSINEENADTLQEAPLEQGQAVVEQQEDASAPADEDATQTDDVQQLLEKLGVSESIATSARVIVQSLREGNASSESIVKLVVQALRHDEDLKNAETQGYLRGRNEVIAAASSAPDDKSPRPLNFPIYTKRSFWDK